MPKDYTEFASIRKGFVPCLVLASLALLGGPWIEVINSNLEMHSKTFSRPHDFRCYLLDQSSFICACALHKERNMNSNCPQKLCFFLITHELGIISTFLWYNWSYFPFFLQGWQSILQRRVPVPGNAFRRSGGQPALASELSQGWHFTREFQWRRRHDGPE